jgi:hypothetical protein
MSFNPQNIKKFRFINYEFKQATIYLNYALDDSYYFTEQIYFPNAKPLNKKRLASLNKVMQQLHLVAGVSYYKTATPNELSIESSYIDKNTIDFMTKLYLNGLGEFAYQNNLNLSNKINFVNTCLASTTEKYEKLTLADKIIVPVGGGKDSIVSIETLRDMNITLFSVGSVKIIQNVVKQANLPYLMVKRSLDPLLFALNKQGAYNGHVPISAIISYILAAAAIIYDFNLVVMSNERSANVGNIKQGDFEINHQYSKSFEFEQDVNKQFKQIFTNFNYFSLLRPLSELSIAKEFAKYTNYHQVFSSCNTNYKINNKNVWSNDWCLNCPKCNFVFLALAPFMSKKQLLSIFHINLLNQADQVANFYELIGHNAHKPFECVGEIEESLVALILLSRNSEWQNDLFIQKFIQNILPKITEQDKLINLVLTPNDKHNIPKHLKSVIKKFK